MSGDLIFPGSAHSPDVVDNAEPDLDVQYCTAMAPDAQMWQWFGESFIEIWADKVIPLVSTTRSLSRSLNHTVTYAR